MCGNEPNNTNNVITVNNNNSNSTSPFSNRKWLVYDPVEQHEYKHDLYKVHPRLTPFLGEMYWTPEECGARLTIGGGECGALHDNDNHQSRKMKDKSLLTPSTMAESYDSPIIPSSPFTKIGLQQDITTSSSSTIILSQQSRNNETLFLSLDSTDEDTTYWEEQECRNELEDTEISEDDDDNDLNLLLGGHNEDDDIFW